MPRSCSPTIVPTRSGCSTDDRFVGPRSPPVTSQPMTSSTAPLDPRRARDRRRRAVGPPAAPVCSPSAQRAVAGVLYALRDLHSGHIGDYIVWWTGQPACWARHACSRSHDRPPTGLPCACRRHGRTGAGRLRRSAAAGAGPQARTISNALTSIASSCSEAYRRRGFTPSDDLWSLEASASSSAPRLVAIASRHLAWSFPGQDARRARRSLTPGPAGVCASRAAALVPHHKPRRRPRL